MVKIACIPHCLFDQLKVFALVRLAGRARSNRLAKALEVMMSQYDVTPSNLLDYLQAAT